MVIEQLPSRVSKISVCADNREVGVLTHGSVHHYQPTQSDCYISLTMTKKGLDGYSSGALHPIFAQNLPEGFNRLYIAEKLARYARVNDMYLLALKLADSKAFPNRRHLLKLAESRSFRIRDAGEIIERMADQIGSYLERSNEVMLFSGLKESIQKSVAGVMTTNHSGKSYRHDKKRKFE